VLRMSLGYSDFQCPYCARFAQEILPEIDRKYIQTGRVQLAFRHLPLPMHQNAVIAAIGAECAGTQRRFWEMHDKLFAAGRIDESAIVAIAQSLKLDTKIFTNCLSDSGVRERVLASATTGRTLGLNGTPAFLLGSRVGKRSVKISTTISGAKPLNEFVENLEHILRD